VPDVRALVRVPAAAAEKNSCNDRHYTRSGYNDLGSQSVPSPRLLKEQAAWLSPARGRLLRRVHIARRRSVLDLACGIGAVTEELTRRSGGRVVALDRQHSAMVDHACRFAGARRLCGDTARLPFKNDAFDLVFGQFALLWLDVAETITEVRRVLQPGGVWVAIEPDYGGMIEHPPEISTCDIWLSALQRCGADPEIGRKLPGLLQRAGFSVRVDLLDRLEPPSTVRYRFLHELPLTVEEKTALNQAEQADGRVPNPDRIAHLPMFLITAAQNS
jgi:SAM-dependent methyltransferase